MLQLLGGVVARGIASVAGKCGDIRSNTGREVDLLVSN